MFFKSSKPKTGTEPNAGSSVAHASAPNGDGQPRAMSASEIADRSALQQSPDAKSASPKEPGAGISAAASAGTRQPPEELKRRAVVARRASMHFGQIVSVLMRSDQLKRMTLEDVERVVVPAVATGQFLVAEAQSAANGLTAPIGVLLWASVSDDVDRRLSSALERPLRLATNEWTSGKNAWLVAAAGESRVVGSMLERLQTTALKDRPLKAVSRDSSGQPSLKVWPAA